MSPTKVRIFISSPGDVQEEREIARGVVQQLGRTFAGRLQLQAVLWEELPLSADASFQQGIDLMLSESGIDVAVFILWSRLGSPTGPLMVGNQGRQYRSGTEREWHLMLLAREEAVKRGQEPRPAIIVYTKNDDVSFEERLRGKADELKAADLQQKLAVNQFIKEEFHDAKTGVNLRAFHSFDHPTTFAKQLRTHLTGLLESMFGEQLDRPVWNVAEQGPPFRGLDVFEVEHSPIFFGREDEIVAIRNHLREQACRGCAFLLISGASGTGKSSLARAGVLPDICTHEVDNGIGQWRRLMIKPNQLGENLLGGLTTALMAQDALPELAKWSDDICTTQDAEQFSGWLIRLSMRVKDALHACETGRSGSSGTRLVVLIDQLEELFSNAAFSAAEVEQFFQTLETLSRSGLVWIVATVRSDFYHECQKVPTLVRMKDGQVFDLLAPAPDALQRVVTGPAQLAGLKFEKEGEHSLADTILREAAGRSELLPLVEYLLLDLFEHRTPDNVLTYKRFRELGGVEGALRQRCETTFNNMPSHVQAKLPAVLSKLVTLSGDDLNTAVRRTVPLQRFKEDPAEQQFLDAMVAERLFTTSSDSSGVQVVSVTHEAVLRVWPRVTEWTDRNRTWLRIRNRVEQSQSRWKNEKDDSLLLAQGVPLREANQLLEEAPHLLDDETRAFIEQSQAYHLGQTRRRKRIQLAGLASLVLMIAVASWYAIQTRNRISAEGQVNGLVAANTAEVGNLIDKLKAYQGWALPMLRRQFTDAAQGTDAKLHAALGLANVGSNPNAESLAYLKQQALHAAPTQLAPLAKQLSPHRESFVSEYWSIALDEKRSAADRFHAGCYLANLDTEHTNWRDAKWTEFVANQLVTVSPSFLSQYQELLRPVKSNLLAPLTSVFKDAARGEVARSFATTLLADYARDNVSALCDLVVAAEPAADKVLFPLLAAHRTEAIERFEALLNEELKPDWHDVPLDPKWTAVSPATKSEIESAGGLIEERFAFCTSMSWLKFQALAETLRPSGYRPTRVRPWMDGTEAKVAAVWKRDGLEWVLKVVSDRSELPEKARMNRSASSQPALLLQDITRLPAPNTPARYLTLWSQALDDSEQRRLAIDLLETQLTAHQQQMTEQGFTSQQMLTVWTDDQRQRHYSGLWSNRGAVSEARATYDGQEYVYEPQWDVAVAALARLPDPLASFKQQLRQIANLSKEQQQDPRILKIRATARLQTGNVAGALVDIEEVLKATPEDEDVLRMLPIALVRLGKTEEAAKALAEYEKLNVDDSFKVYIRGQVSAWQGNWDKAWQMISDAEAVKDASLNDLYNLACTSALCAVAAKEKEPSQVKRFEDRALAILKLIMDRDYRNIVQLKDDTDFGSLHNDQRFLDLVARLEPPARYAGVWQADVEFASRVIDVKGDSIDTDALRGLMQAGYRPEGIAMENGAGKLLLHVPNIKDDAKEQLSLAQASAAIALLRLRAPEKVWPWLEDKPDPRMRSYLLNRLAKVSSDVILPQDLIAQLKIEPRADRRRAIIQALGELAKANLLTSEMKSELVSDLAIRYADDPEPGVHGMSEWTLRQLGALDKIGEVRATFATGQAKDDRRWYVTKTGVSDQSGPLTMVIVDANEEFLMGSPVDEAERFGGPTSKDETLHRRHIGRRFAISAQEVTVAQFMAFRKRHEFNRVYSREPDAPANSISWYDAAEYCNWLSEREGIPRSEWCYDRDQKFADGMMLPTNYWERTGYRLPSEAEWEYSCRAGTITPRYYGVSEQLLGEYAWYTKVSLDKHMLSVGTLRPNGLGMFDILGNVLEWTQDRNYLYSEGRKRDLGNIESLSDSKSRALRGGSFFNQAQFVRSAYRFSNRPGNRNNGFGFRVSRTYR